MGDKMMFLFEGTQKHEHAGGLPSVRLPHLPTPAHQQSPT